MKGSDLKVVAIILAIALFFTIVTSNAVSIASVVMLAKGGVGGSAPAAQGDAAGGQQGTTPSNGTSTTPSNGTSTTPSSGTSTTPSNGTSTTPSGGTSTTPADNGSSSTPAGNNDQPADKPADNGNTDKPAGGNDQPADKPADQPTAGPSKEDVFKEYQKAAQEVKTKGNASYNKKEWQKLENLEVGKVGGIIQPIIDGYMTTEDQAEVQVTEKGEKSMDRFPACTLTDMSKVASATKEGNVITIIMVDEDTPRNAESSFLGQVTNSILFWDDIEKELQGISVIKGYDNAHVVYAGYKITAEIVDGKFVSLRHEAVANITCPDAKITVFTLPLSGTLYNYCVYDNFQY